MSSLIWIYSIDNVNVQTFSLLWQTNKYLDCRAQSLRVYKKMNLTLTIEWEYPWHAFYPDSIFFNDIRNIAKIQWFLVHISGYRPLSNYIYGIEWFVNDVKIIWFCEFHVFWLLFFFRFFSKMYKFTIANLVKEISSEQLEFQFIYFFLSTEKVRLSARELIISSI